MPRESLRHAVPSSYDEEMEQLRIALEISARASTSHDVHASSSARNSRRPSRTTRNDFTSFRQRERRVVANGGTNGTSGR